MDSVAPPLAIPKRSKPPRRRNLLYCHHQFKRPKGYRFSMLCGAVAALVVFVINVVLTLWAIRKSGVHDDVSKLHLGSCEKTKALSVGIH